MLLLSNIIILIIAQKKQSKLFNISNLILHHPETLRLIHINLIPGKKNLFFGYFISGLLSYKY